MTNTEFIAAQITDITSRSLSRALNELQDGFGPDDHQALDAPRFIPPTTWGDSITMRQAMVIPARGGDHAQK